MYLFSCSRLRFSVLLLGLKEEFIKMVCLMQACLPTGQLKDDFKWFESSLTKTERIALSRYK